jgi:cytochrome c oxidase assembly factor CtaG
MDVSKVRTLEQRLYDELLQMQLLHHGQHWVVLLHGLLIFWELVELLR